MLVNALPVYDSRNHQRCVSALQGGEAGFVVSAMLRQSKLLTCSELCRLYNTAAPRKASCLACRVEPKS